MDETYKVALTRFDERIRVAGTADIEAEILPPQKQVRSDFFPAKGLLVKVILDPEVFETAGGGMYIWFDERQQPARGIVEKA